MDELTRRVYNEIQLYIQFADNILLIDENGKGIGSKVRSMERSLETKGLGINRPNTEYMLRNIL